VSLPDFQACLARLITEAELSVRVAAEGSSAFGARVLTDRESRRLRAIAGSRGLTVTRKLHRGFRLGKLLSMLPLTCARLGDEVLGQEATAFWRERPSRSFYFWEEAISFCDFLAARAAAGEHPLPFLAEVVRYERASLLLQCAPERLSEPAVALLWPADPRPVLQALAASEPVPALPATPHLMVGERSADGQVTWTLRR
jgi:hypothetical protein